jgi:ribonuclease VapC
VILDSSVIVAIVRREPGFEELVARVGSEEHLAVGAPTLAETAIVLEARMGVDSRAVLEHFLRDFGVATVSFGSDHWREAARAFRRFGKGRHPAALNFGDCLTYAVARLAERPLLCVGDDFSRTDLPLA